jgi:hypothetical protein
MCALGYTHGSEGDLGGKRKHQSAVHFVLLGCGNRRKTLTADSAGDRIVIGAERRSSAPHISNFAR